MAHGYLSYQDNRGEVDYLGKIYRAIKDFLDEKEKREKRKQAVDEAVQEVQVREEQAALPGAETPLLTGGRNTNVSEIPLQKMLGGSSLQRSLPGASAVNPDVVGGAATPGVSRRRGITGEGYFGDSIVDIGATNLGVERDLGGDMFTKRLDTFSDSGGGSEEVVQAIDRLTFVTMSLVSTTKEQTNQQKMIAGAQQQQTEKLARKSKAAAEESALEMGQDLSGNSAYQGLLRAATGAMSGAGGSSRGGGPGFGLGGKVLAKNMLKGATRRGAGRTGGRLGAALGGKLMGGFGARMGAKLGAKGVGKIAGGALAKSLGKKIPLVGLGLGAVFAAQRAMQGDFVGAGLELASGAASTVPGIGTAGSVGIDAALAARDMGAVPFADGGIISDATLGLVGEKGKEGVFPLEGAEGRKTFLMFGEGILEAQRRNKSENAKRLAEGLTQYYDKQNGWEKFMGALGEFIKSSPLGKFFRWGGKDDPNSPGGGDRLGGGGAKVGNDLFSTISGGEGGIDSYNTGVAGSQAGYTPPKAISKMTVGQVMDEQAKGSLFAVGKYQIIPDTMKGFVSGAGISRDDIFNEETQDKFKQYVIDQKRPSVGNYLKGAEGSSLEKAQMALAAEFASVGVPRDMKKGEYNGEYPVRDIKKGESLYSDVGGNAASISPEVIAEALEKEKALNNKPDPTPDPPDGGPLTLDPSEIPGANATPEQKAEYEEKLAAIAKRQAAALKAKQASAATTGGDWAKSLNLGNAPFIDFGSDNQFRAIKKDSGGYTILKKGGLGMLMRIDTKGRNFGLKEQLIEAAKSTEVSSLNRVDNDANKLASASADTSTDLNARSRELVAMASTGNTTINNITNVESNTGASGGNAPANVPIAPGSDAMGLTSFITALTPTVIS